MSGFDTRAVREWGDIDVPDSDNPKRHALWNQIRSDVVAACDYIDELETSAVAAQGWLYHATEGGGMKSARSAKAVLDAILPTEAAA